MSASARSEGNVDASGAGRSAAGGADAALAAAGAGGAASGGAPRRLTADECATLRPTLSTDDGWVSQSQAAASGSVRVVFQARPGAAALNGVVALGSAAVSDFPQAPILVRFADTGRVDARDGGDYAADASITYQAGKWYTVDLTIDLAARTYAVSVGECGSALTALVTDAAFRSDAAAPQELAALSIWSSGTGSLEVADVTWGGEGTSGGSGGASSGGASSGGSGGFVDSVPPADGSVPSASTTGITDEWCPRWDELKKSTSGRVITTPGTVIEYEDIDGQLDIQVEDVLVRCSRVTQVDDPGDNGMIHCRSDNGCTGGLLVEDTFLSGADPTKKYGAIFTCVSDECSVRRTHMVRGCDTTKFEGGLVMDSFMEDRGGGKDGWPDAYTAAAWAYCPDGSAHGDAQQISGDSPAPTWWIHNRVEGPWRYATSAFIYGGGDNRDITIDGNWIQGGGFQIYLAHPSPPPSFVRVTNNTFVTDSWIQNPPDSWEGSVFSMIDSINCLEMKKDGQWTNELDTPDPNNGNKTVVDEDYGVSSVAANIGECNAGIADAAERARANNGEYPRTPWTGISPVPTWSVSGLSASASACAAGTAACSGIDLAADASGSGDAVSPPRTTGSPRWRFNCGGSATNTGGAHPRGADLWYAYPACDGQAHCDVTDACDFSAESAGSYTVRMYSESGPGSGVRVSGHAELTFTVE